jgi:exonuclease SbcC
MILKKVILDNFRAHEHIEFEPSENGMTAISGNNGAGKSTIVNGFAWSLFGSKFQGLKNKQYIRYGVDPKTERVGVTSFIQVGNNEYKIERIITGASTTSCRVYILADNEYKEVAGPATSHSEKYIKELLGFTDKEFYSSFFIQQKQVDSIIHAPTKERGLIIERMLGIDVITDSITQAKQDSKLLQQSLNVIQQGSVEDIEAALENQKKVVKNLLDGFKKIKTEYEKVTKGLGELNARYLAEREKQEKKQELESLLNIAKNNIANTEERLNESLSKLDSLPKKIEYSDSLYNQVQADIEKTGHEKDELLLRLSSLNTRYSELVTLFNEKLPKDLDKIVELLRQKQELNNQNLSSYLQRLTILKEQEKSCQQFLQDLEKGVAECPYCHAPIKNINDERKAHTKELQDIQAEIAEISELQTQEEANKSALLDESLQLQNYLEIRQKQTDLKSEFACLKIEIEKVTKDHENVSKIYSTMIKKLQSLETLKQQAATISSIKATIKWLNERLTADNQEKNKLESEITELHALKKTEYAKLELSLNSIQTQKQKHELDALAMKKDIEIEKEKGRSLDLQLSQAKEAREKFNTISNQLVIINNTIKNLTDFKKLRVESAIPELSELTSDLVRKFTDNDFQDVVIDNQFNITVNKNNGQELPVNALSGGEESVVAIALRLAISLFLNGNSNGLIVMDEVLVSQSSNREQNILDTIAGLNNSQIVLIAHSSLANSLADRTFTLGDR